MSDYDKLSDLAEKINLLAAIDSSGRGGNLFFLTIFDQHQEVACCPIVQYSYSYMLAEFHGDNEIDSRAAHDFITEKSYFRLLYNEPVGDNAVLFERMGGEPKALFNRERMRSMIDEYFERKTTVTRRQIIAVPMVAYAIARGHLPEKLKYVVIGDAISKRSENVVEGFSGSIIDSILEDFPEAKIYRLVRDPRATFASPRHQFVNSLGNMYAVRPGNFLSRLWTLLFGVLKIDNGCVYLFWLLYLKQSEIAICEKELQYPECIHTVKNEDLNLNFVNTMIAISKNLDIQMLKSWESEKFEPTVIGTPWCGAGAYNSRYQRATSGLLENDPQDVARRVTGPNEYVTRRWRTRLNRHEIKLIEYLFYDDLIKYKYDILHYKPETRMWSIFFGVLVSPFEGELPRIKWIKVGFTEGKEEGLSRLFYAFVFPIFFIASRIKLIDYRLKGIL